MARVTATTMGTASVQLGPSVPDWDWTTGNGADLLVTLGFDPDREAAAMAAADARGTALLSVRLSPEEVLIGPFRPSHSGSADACAGCAHARLGHRPAAIGAPSPAASTAAPTAPPACGYPPLVADLVAAVLAGADFGAGDLVAISAAGQVRRHTVRPSQDCGLCAPAVGAVDIAAPPEPVRLLRRPADGPVATRGTEPPFRLDLDAMRAATLDPRFGPATRTRRNGLMSFALSQVLFLGDSPPGQGRGTTFREAEVIGYLEGFERSAGFPHTTPLLRGATRRELAGLALDPAALGLYTDAQYESPLARVRRHDADTLMDWAWARPLDGGPARLVPADIAFYSYHYPQLVTPESRARNYFLESSSGSALGASFEEAALHSLLELAERDAFLLSWHAARPLPQITPPSVRDPQSRFLLRRIADAGYDLHLLRATQDIELPVVWALAIARGTGLPASFSAAGSNPDPVLAVRAALWEVAQCVLAGATWDEPTMRRLADDPGQVDELHDHIVRNAAPALLPRVSRVLGGPRISLDDAFPGWPEVLVGAAGGDVTETLRFVAALFRAAGLATILAVDQSSREHGALGMSVVRCVVPGIVPMCFGQAQQRLAGLPRLAALAPPGAAPFDPHPFP